VVGRTGDVLANLTDAERNMLVWLPRWIAAAASSVQPDNATRTHRENEAGFLTIALGRQRPNAFLTEVARQTFDSYDHELAVSGVDANTPEGIDTVVERAGWIWAAVRAKAAPADADAYRQWLLDITDEVITAARSHGLLGIGGTLVTPLEQGLRDRLAAALV
jgi:hypothetical protein